MTDLSKQKPYTKLEHYLHERMLDLTRDEHSSALRANNLARQLSDLMQAMRKLQNDFALEILRVKKNAEDEGCGTLAMGKFLEGYKHIDPVVLGLVLRHENHPISHCLWCGRLAPLRARQVRLNEPYEMACAWESGCNG